MPANRALSGPVLARRRLAYDGDRGRSRAIAIRECVALNECDSHRVEVVHCDLESVSNRGVDFRLGWPPFNDERPARMYSGERRAVDGANGADAGQRLGAL